MELFMEEGVRLPVLCHSCNAFKILDMLVNHKSKEA